MWYIKYTVHTHMPTTKTTKQDDNANYIDEGNDAFDCDYTDNNNSDKTEREKVSNCGELK